MALARKLRSYCPDSRLGLPQPVSGVRTEPPASVSRPKFPPDEPPTLTIWSPDGAARRPGNARSRADCDKNSSTLRTKCQTVDEAKLSRSSAGRTS